jgi:hypothetical protein
MAFIGVLITSVLVGSIVHTIFAQGLGNMLAPMFLVFFVFPALIIFQVYRQMRRLRRIWQSYRIFIEDGLIARHIEGFPELRVSKANVISIEERASGDLVIHTVNPQAAFGISRDILDIGSLRKELETWGAFRPTKSRGLWRWPLRIFIFLAFGVAFLGINPWLTVVISPLLIAVMIWSFVQIQKNKQLPRRTKLMVFIVIFPVVGLIGATAMAIIRIVQGN